MFKYLTKSNKLTKFGQDGLPESPADEDEDALSNSPSSEDDDGLADPLGNDDDLPYSPSGDDDGLPYAPSGGGGGGGSRPSASPQSIKSMQSEMIAFGNLIFKSDLGTFLTYNYGQKFKGKHGEKDLTFKESKRYTEISEQITLIGSAVNEKSPDGIWGPRTQTAIENIQSLSGTILDLASAISFNDADFSNAKRKELGDAIPDVVNPSKEMSGSDIAERCNTITPLLKQLNSFCKKFDLFLSKEYKQYDKSDIFAPAETSRSQSPELSLDQYDQAYLDQVSDKNYLFSSNGKNFKLKLSDLKTPESFRSALISSLGEAEKPWIDQNYQKLIDAIKEPWLKQLEKEGKILQPNDISQIEKIKSLIKKCDLLVKSNQNNQEIKSYQSVVDDFVAALKRPDVYSVQEERQKLEQLITRTIKDIESKSGTTLIES